MKQILFILISIAFLQAPINTSLGNTPAIYAQKCATATDADKVQQNKKMTDEEITESNFKGFIADDVAGGKKIKDGETLYYTKYSEANEALNMLLNFIEPANRRVDLSEGKYDSYLITVEWKENSTRKTEVKDGFAQIKVKFKKSKENYTVTFCK